MQKILLSISIAASLLGASVALAQTSSTTTTVSGTTTLSTLPVIFPIAELGGCDSREACKLYCDDITHLDACMSYAQAHGLMKKDEVTLAKQVRHGGGPGGCNSKESCRAYCEDTSHMQECVIFGLKNRLLTIDQASSTLQFQAALKTTGGPGGCTTTQECKAYCSDATHEAECRAFADMHGFNRLKNDLDHPDARIGSDTPQAYARISEHGTSTIPGLPGLIFKDGKLASSSFFGNPTGRPPVDTTQLRGKCSNLEDCKKMLQQIQASTSGQLPPNRFLPPNHEEPSTNAAGVNPPPEQNNIDYTRPPYHCTPSQADEGACDADQFPGYKGPTMDENGNTLGGAVWNAIRFLFHF